MPKKVLGHPNIVNAYKDAQGDYTIYQLETFNAAIA
jgi:hypothetical protein